MSCRHGATSLSLALCLILAACDESTDVQAAGDDQQSATSSASEPVESSDDPTSVASGDAEACAQYESQRDQVLTYLVEEGAVAADDAEELDHNLTGSFVDATTYLDREGLAAARSGPVSFAPRWLPAELVGRPVQVFPVTYPASGSPAGAPVGLDLYWPTDSEPAELPGEVRLRLSMSDPGTGRTATTAATGTNINGAPLTISVSVPSATLEWQDGAGRAFALTTSADEHLINCREMLAIARSIGPIGQPPTTTSVTGALPTDETSTTPTTE